MTSTILSYSAIGLMLILAGTVQAAMTSQEITDALIKQIKANNKTSEYTQRSFPNAARLFLKDAKAGFSTCAKATCPVWKTCARSVNYNMSKCWTMEDCSNVLDTFDTFNVTKDKFLCDPIPVTTTEEKTDLLVNLNVYNPADRQAFRAALDSFTKSPAITGINTCIAPSCKKSEGNICARFRSYDMSKCWTKVECDRAFEIFSSNKFKGMAEKFFCGTLPARSIKEITDELVANMSRDTGKASTFLDAAGSFARGARVGIKYCESDACEKTENMVCGRSSNYDMSKCMKKDACKYTIQVFNMASNVTKGKFFCGAVPGANSSTNLMANMLAMLVAVFGALFYAST